ncbi:hypothetical protein Y032_0205g1937 [Ancylostoma ceylanicum]|uniref:Uncharacterized protein n=1 Tax=Ancylostoma ceylanicum TaxID=53326 RepID=A0A016SLD9_9BILA|nr:hypothetical protein Y032_0205g1937 [Ancylostoma ceylanicum]
MSAAALPIVSDAADPVKAEPSGRGEADAQSTTSADSGNGSLNNEHVISTCAWSPNPCKVSRRISSSPHSVENFHLISLVHIIFEVIPCNSLYYDTYAMLKFADVGPVFVLPTFGTKI